MIRFHIALLISSLAVTTTLASEGADASFSFTPPKPNTSIGNFVGQAIRYVLPESLGNFVSRYQGEAAGYQINLAYCGVSDTSIFTSAQSRWQSVVTSDLEEVSGICGCDSCGCLPCTVDDLHICGSYTSIDGTGGVLGAAAPTRIRSSNSLPYTGEMIFDSADVDAGNINEGVILHEMGHILGIGTLWTTLGLTNSNVPTCEYAFSSRASEEYRSLSGCSASIPLENDFGSGTACGHWDETCFDSELMTGFSDNPNQLSRITVAGLQDLGYDVDYTKADAYTCLSMDISCVCTCLKRDLRGAIADGAVRPIGGGGDENEAAAEHAAGEPRRNKRRRLSDEGRAEAIAYGKSILETRTKERSTAGFSLLNNDGDGGIYIGDKVVNVLYMENGETFDVLVVNF